MRAVQSKNLRRLLEIEKPTPASESGLYVEGENLMFRQRRNPQMNLYRQMKRRFTRGW
jgi:hypothetical protein